MFLKVGISLKEGCGFQLGVLCSRGHRRYLTNVAAVSAATASNWILSGQTHMDLTSKILNCGVFVIINQKNMLRVI